MTARDNDLRTQCLDNIFTGKRTIRALLSSRVKRVFGAVATVAALTAALGLTAASAGAGVTATNDKFCAVVSGDQGLAIDFSGLGRDEAKYAAGISRAAAKTGVPAKLKTDLTKLATVYDQIAHGASSKKVVADQQTFMVSALTRFGKYLAANCIASVPSTPSTASASASAQSSASAQATAGTWNGTWKSDKYPLNSTFRMTLTIAAGSLTGDITVNGADCITTGTMTGTVDGTTIRFGAVQASNSIAYTGTISGASMVGTYTSPCGNDTGTWSANR